MTLCIAAGFYGQPEGLGGVVLCCDERRNRGLVSADDSNKIRWALDGRLVFLLAGGRTAADQLYLSIIEAIEGQHPKRGILGASAYVDFSDEIQITKFIQLVKHAAQKRKRELMEEHVSLTLGMSFEEFTAKSSSILRETHYLDTWHELKSINLNAELILATVAREEAIILRVDSSGDVHWENHFSTIGTGGPIAEAFLVQKNYDDRMGVEECVYRVYEAKVAAEKNRDVGPTTCLEIMDVDSEGYNFNRMKLTDASFAAIDKMVRKRMRTMPILPKCGPGLFMVVKDSYIQDGSEEHKQLEASEESPVVDDETK
jgi:20S proteasome alpha/beta subunit